MQNRKVLSDSEQCVIVTTKDWTATNGVMQFFERSDQKEPWTRRGAPFVVVVGKNGLGWGRGIIETSSLPGPQKKEGDGKAPAGIFRLVSAFGYAPKCETKLPYLPLTADIEGVDDPKSRYYNQLVARSTITSPDWQSSEKMRRADDLYKWGVVVAHNAAPALPGAGSCIFLHVWKSESNPTVGCTAMPEKNILDLISWLDPKKNPLLIQLPADVYEQLRADWNLPAVR